MPNELPDWFQFEGTSLFPVLSLPGFTFSSTDQIGCLSYGRTQRSIQFLVIEIMKQQKQSDLWKRHIPTINATSEVSG